MARLGVLEGGEEGSLEGGGGRDAAESVVAPLVPDDVVSKLMSKPGMIQLYCMYNRVQ